MQQPTPAFERNQSPRSENSVDTTETEEKPHGTEKVLPGRQRYSADDEPSETDDYPHRLVFGEQWLCSRGRFGHDRYF